MLKRYSEDIIEAVWKKGKIVPGYNSSKVRKDQCGAWIKRDKYGDRNSSYGWEIDHISPGESDSLYNLRPLQWQNNVATSDGRLTCPVTANGNRNEERY